MQLRKVSRQQLLQIARACELLGTAQALMAKGGADKARQAIARARKSADGALRHADRCARRTADAKDG